MSWCVFAVAVVLSFRKVLAVPEGRGDITGLVIATVAGGLGLALLGDFVRRRDSRSSRRD